MTSFNYIAIVYKDSKKVTSVEGETRDEAIRLAHMKCAALGISQPYEVKCDTRVKMADYIG